jgi:hypothetical protein
MISSKECAPLVALLGSAAAQAALGAVSDASPQAAPSAAVAPQCDSVSFATGTPQNRAACRRVFARQVHFALPRHKMNAACYRAALQERFTAWHGWTATASSQNII